MKDGIADSIKRYHEASEIKKQRKREKRLAKKLKKSTNDSNETIETKSPDNKDDKEPGRNVCVVIYINLSTYIYLFYLWRALSDSISLAVGHASPRYIKVDSNFFLGLDH